MLSRFTILDIYTGHTGSTGKISRQETPVQNRKMANWGVFVVQKTCHNHNFYDKMVAKGHSNKHF